jgi:hypothetical protein
MTKVVPINLVNDKLNNIDGPRTGGRQDDDG